MQRPIIRVLSVLMLIAVFLTACGGEATTAPPQIQPTEAPEATQAPEPTEAPEEESAASEPAAIAEIELPEMKPADNPGDVVSAGSSTVFPLAEVIAGLYEGEGGGNVTIDSIGSGAGFERFCVTGETDIANASRPIKDSEVEACAALTPARTPVEFRVGTDALAVTVSAENDFVTDVTLEELAAIFSTAETWADVRPEWPAEPIQRYIPGTDSGTFDYFVEMIFEKDPEPMLNAANLQLSEDDNVLVQGIMGSPYAIGFFGYAYYVENAASLNVLAINGVVADNATVDSSEYPLARPLFLYSDAAIMQAKPQVAAYINYFLTHVNEVIGAVGYFPANPEGLDLARLLWLNAMIAK